MSTCTPRWYICTHISFTHTHFCVISRSFWLACHSGDVASKSQACCRFPLFLDSAIFSHCQDYQHRFLFLSANDAMLVLCGTNIVLSISLVIQFVWQLPLPNCNLPSIILEAYPDARIETFWEPLQHNGLFRIAEERHQPGHSGKQFLQESETGEKRSL